MTLFPDSMAHVLGESIIGRAAQKGILTINCRQIRDYTENRQKQVDDYPYGGGCGCVMMAQPLYSAVQDLRRLPRSRVIYLSPQGERFTQETAKRLVGDYDQLVLVCGHYEGIDERFIEECVDEEISIGDFVLTGGEIPAMALTDAVCRLVPGVLSDEESYTGESHWDGLLEYPQYTRPAVWQGREVPPVLLTGNHADIVRWRRIEQLRRTRERRPDMFERLRLDSETDRELLASLEPPGAVPLRFEHRRGEPEDIPAIMAIIDRARVLLRDDGVPQWQGEYPASYDFERDIELGECWVFLHEGELVGVMALCHRVERDYDENMTSGSWLTEPGTPYSVIHRSVVHESYRGSGLAREMFALAEELAAGRGMLSIKLDTFPQNARMRAFLDKLGYTHCGLIEMDYNGDILSLVVYEKLL